MEVLLQMVMQKGSHNSSILQAYDPQDIAHSPYRMRVNSIPPIFASKVY